MKSTMLPVTSVRPCRLKEAARPCRLSAFVGRLNFISAALISTVMMVTDSGVAEAQPSTLSEGADCSPFIGQATINEVYTGGGGGDAFIEIKILDTGIPQSTFEQWTLSYDSEAGGIASGISVSEFGGSYPWLVLTLENSDDIDFNPGRGPGLEVRLDDADGNAIDYLSAGGYSGQFSVSCEFLYDTEADVAQNPFTIMRIPDGTGSWERDGPGGSGDGPTEGGSNDEEDDPPDPVLDHIRIDHPGSGVTCSPEQIELRACANADCSSLVDEPVDVDLTSPAGNWSADSLTFTGVTTVDLQVPIPGDVDLDAQAIDPLAANPARCVDGGTAPCVMSWTEAGFLIDVPNHVSATVQSATVEAVRTEDNTLACTPAFSNETRPVEFGSDYINPGSGILSLDVSGSSIPVDGMGVIVNLDFDSYGVAEIEVVYPDVGDVRLNALFEGQDDLEEDLVMTGHAQFITRPDTFELDIADLDGAVDADGPVFKVAGETFDVTVNALNADGDLTPNFGRESEPEAVDLEQTLIAPAGGNNPPVMGDFEPFAENCDGVDVDDGQACGEFSWSEVGIIGLTPRLATGAYLGTEDVVGDNVDDVGRFIPADFEQTVENDGIFATGCDGSFTYIGQPFGYTTNPELEVRPRNVDGAVTQNYTGEFARLAAADIPLTGPDEDDEQTLRDDDATPLRVDADLVTGSLVEDDDEPGVHIYTFADDDRYTYVRNFDPGETPDGDARISPFDGALTIAVDEFSDADDVTASSLVDVTPMGTQLRFGRMVLDGAVGSELAPLDLPVRIEVWDEDTWQVRADGCTTIVEDRILLTGSLDNETAPDEDRLPLAFDDDGRTELRLTAPGQTGFVDVELDLELALGADDEVITWLRDDLDADGQFVENPAARASFGLFGGNPRQIYREEVLR